MPDDITGTITEHESRGDDKNTGSGPEMSAKDEATVKKVKKLLDKSKKKRSQYDRKWLDYYKFYRGVQWPEDRPSYRHSEVINMIYPTLQSMVAIMMDVRPKVEFNPTNPTDRAFADVMNKLFRADWEKYKWLNTTTEVILEGHLYGAGFSSLTWNADANYGEGCLVYRSEDPFYIFPQPDTCDINGMDEYAAETFQIAEPRDTDWLRRRYPKKKHLIKPDMVDLGSLPNRTELGTSKFRSAINGNVELTESYPSDAAYLDEPDKSLVITTYMKPQDLIEEPFEDDDGKKKYRQKLKHPKGRKIVVAGGAVVEDNDELPFDDLKFPYSKYINSILPREFWGVSEVEPLESPQKIFNKLVSFALDVLTITGNPIWILDTTSGIDPDSIFNRPGLIVEKEPGSEVRREQGVNLQPFVMQLIDRMADWFNTVSNQADVTRGIAPASVTANAAIENLQEAGQTAVRQKMRNMDNYMTDFGQMYASRVMQFYTQKRVFAITNDDQSLSFFRFNMDQDEQGRPVGVFAEYVENDMGEMVETEPNMFQIQADLDVRASTGTGLPFAKAEKEQRLLQLFDRQIIDGEEVLNGIDYPNAEKVLARVAEKQAAAAEAEAQQGA